MLNIVAARRWLRDHLDPEEPIHAADAAVLAAAALVVSTTVDTPDDQEGPP
jgi:hypothetical protein